MKIRAIFYIISGESIDDSRVSVTMDAKVFRKVVVTDDFHYLVLKTQDHIDTTLSDAFTVIDLKKFLKKLKSSKEDPIYHQDEMIDVFEMIANDAQRSNLTSFVIYTNDMVNSKKKKKKEDSNNE